MRAVYLIPAVFFSLLAAGIAACANDASPQAPASVPRDINTSVFVCNIPGQDSFVFTIRQGPGELAAWLPLKFERPYLVLSEQHDDGMPEYVEGDVRIRLQGDLADLVVGESRYSRCLRDAERSVWEHAKLSGVDFRAAGRDPDWLLEIRNQRQIQLSVAADRIDLQSVATDVEQQGDLGIYRAPTDTGMLEVQIGGPDCTAGRVSGTAVAVFLDGVMYSGCGRALH